MVTPPTHLPPAFQTPSHPSDLCRCLLFSEIIFGSLQQGRPHMLPCPHPNYYMNLWHAFLSLQAMGSLRRSKSSFYLLSKAKTMLDTGIMELSLHVCVHVYLLSCLTQWTTNCGSYFFHGKLVSFLIQITESSWLWVSETETPVIESGRHWRCNSQMSPVSEKNTWQEEGWIFLSHLHSVSGPLFFCL